MQPAIAVFIARRRCMRRPGALSLLIFPGELCDDMIYPYIAAVSEMICPSRKQRRRWCSGADGASGLGVGFTPSDPADGRQRPGFPIIAEIADVTDDSSI